MRNLFVLIILLFIGACSLVAQESRRYIYYTMTVEKGDTIYKGYLPESVIFPPMKFRNDKERMEYTKLVRDVKKTYPYARLVAQNIIETYEFMETLPNEKARKKHLSEAQKFIMAEYKPKMKKLTKNQGKILIKLIDRQTNSTTYDIVKSLIGPFKATIYNTFAGVFGNSLKAEYDPNGKDWMIERIVIEIDQGTL